jgi:hypothetical protein
MRPVTVLACGPVSGITAMEFAPSLTAKRVLWSGEIVTAKGAAPV